MNRIIDMDTLEELDQLLTIPQPYVYNDKLSLVKGLPNWKRRTVINKTTFEQYINQFGVSLDGDKRQLNTALCMIYSFYLFKRPLDISHIYVYNRPTIMKYLLGNPLARHLQGIYKQLDNSILEQVKLTLPSDHIHNLCNNIVYIPYCELLPQIFDYITHIDLSMLSSEDKRVLKNYFLQSCTYMPRNRFWKRQVNFIANTIDKLNQLFPDTVIDTTTQQNIYVFINDLMNKRTHIELCIRASNKLLPFITFNTINLDKKMAAKILRLIS